MTLGPGAILGPYRLTGRLGTGGMGEVYRAVDTRLGRDVAVKVLPTGLASDTDRLRRFESEARAIAALNHPNICTVHDVGEQDGVHFIVMEVVSGETLASLLERGALRIPQALQIAGAIASALDRAHRAGIIHRDVKPANVMISADGIKLLDFGIAKLRPAHSSDTETRSAHDLTAAGAIVGTPAYMAPEQVEGRDVDARADIWALGCVLHEMLTGQRPLVGATPPLSGDVPPSLARLIRACLEKKVDDRWQSAADLARQLHGIEDDLNAPGAQGRRTGVSPRMLASAIVLIAAAVIGIVIGAPRFAATPVPRAVVHARIPFHPADRVGWAAGTELQAASGRPSRTAIALSPDGRLLVFVGVTGGNTRLFRRALDSDRAEPIAGTEGADGPFFAPDSQRIGFWSAGALRWVSIDGGPVQSIVSTPRPRGASWTEDGTILFSAPGGIMVAEPGGSARSLTTVDAKKGEQFHTHPRRIPGTQDVLFTLWFGFMAEDARTAVLRAGSGVTVLLENATDARVVSSYLIALRGGTLIAMPYDANRMRLGQQTTVLDGVMHAVNNVSSGINTGAGQIAISESGHMAYIEGGPYPLVPRWMGWFSRAGDLIETLPVDPRLPMVGLRLSADGRITGWNVQLHGGPIVFDPRRQSSTQLAFDGRTNWPQWTPDQKQIAFLGRPKGRPTAIFRMPADGSAPAEPLTDGHLADPNTATWTPDGSELLFTEQGDIFRLRIAGRVIEPLLATKAVEEYPALSPDGRQLVYVSNDSGRAEVYLSPYPSLAGRRQVSSKGGSAPVWTRGGRELVYWEADTTSGMNRMMSVPVAVDGPLPAPVRLFEKSRREIAEGNPLPSFAITADGARFLFSLSDLTQHPPPPQVNLVLNWVDELERLMTEAQRPIR